MTTICRTCGKTAAKDNKGHGIQFGYCLPPRVCGLLALAEEDMLTKEEADQLNQLLSR